MVKEKTGSPWWRILAARLLQVCGVCVVLVSLFLCLAAGLPIVRSVDAEFHAVEPDYDTLIRAAVGLILVTGWCLGTLWFAFAGLRRLMWWVAGKPIEMTFGGGGYGGGGGYAGGGDGGGCGGDGGGGC